MIAVVVGGYKRTAVRSRVVKWHVIVHWLNSVPPNAAKAKTSRKQTRGGDVSQTNSEVIVNDAATKHPHSHWQLKASGRYQGSSL